MLSLSIYSVQNERQYSICAIARRGSTQLSGGVKVIDAYQHNPQWKIKSHKQEHSYG